MTPAQYADFVYEELNKKSKLAEELYAGSILGNKDFIDQNLSKISHWNTHSTYREDPVTNTKPLDIESVIDAVAHRYNKNPIDILHARKQNFMEKNKERASSRTRLIRV